MNTQPSSAAAGEHFADAERLLAALPLGKRGVVRTDDVVNFLGERPQLLLRAAAACGDPIAALADELAWSTAKVCSAGRQTGRAGTRASR